MTCLPACLLLGVALSAAPDVDVTLLDGRTLTGALESLSASELNLRKGDEATAVAAADVLELRFPRAAAEDALEQSQRIEVRLVDGSVLLCTAYTSGGRSATATNDVLGALEIPLSQVRSVRFAPLDSRVRDAWGELRGREARGDLLVVRKGDALDFVGGVVAEVGDASVEVLVDNREVPVPRERVFGVVYPRPAPARETAVCELTLDSGDRLRLTEIALSESELSATLVSGPRARVPVSRVRTMDFGLGRVRYLADLPETAAYTPVGLIGSEDVLKVRKNGNSLGGALRVGTTIYTRGLWIHSGTTLRYRLNRDYRRLQGVVGIERSSDSCARLSPAVHVVVLGDGKVLLEGDFAWAGEPQTVDLDVSGVRDLEIRVTPVSADTLGACEHLAIAEARVIK